MLKYNNNNYIMYITKYIFIIIMHICAGINASFEFSTLFVDEEDLVVEVCIVLSPDILERDLVLALAAQPDTATGTNTVKLYLVVSTCI